MDFGLSDDQQALVDLTSRILADRSTPDRLDALDSSGEWFDADLWGELADAGILGITVPEELGGAGLGFLELHLVLTEVGATVAHVPLWETAVLGVLPLVAFSDSDDHRKLLADVARGERILTAALTEDGRGATLTPAATARRTGGEWRLDGVWTRVPCGQLADRILVPARTPDGSGLFLIDPDRAGVTLQSQATISGRPHARLELDGVVVPDADVLGRSGQRNDRLTWLMQHAQSGLASMQAGVIRAALELAARHTSEREQFGRKIGSFQAVGQRLADAFIETEGVRLTSLQAAWRLAAGLPAGEAVTIAKWWAAEGAHRVVHAAQHVHGGVGIDYDYPLHRYFTAAKEIEFTLGHGTDQLLELGRRMADPGQRPM